MTKKLVILTVEEDKVWSKAFEYHKADGLSDVMADRLAFKDTAECFPRLKAFSGCVPGVHVDEDTPPSDVMDFCPYCGEIMEFLASPRSSPRRRCVAGKVTFIQSALGTLEVEYTEQTEIPGRVHSYIDHAKKKES